MLKTFTLGGVHPEENKLTSHKKIEILPVPPIVIIPVSQHIGAPAKILVAKGDKVRTGQLIAESGGFVSANIHSSVTGTVIKVDSFADPGGYRRLAIQIQTEADEWIPEIDISDTIISQLDLDSETIIKKITSAGLVGLGGATFPSHVKLSVPQGKKAKYLVVNGVECEPWLTSDHSLMLARGKEIIIGIRIMMKALKVEKAILGIENNKPDAIDLMTQLAANEKGISVVALQVKYPQGGEKQLIKALLNREVPSGGLPIDVGVVAFNVGSVFAAYQAVQKNKPLIERVVTVTGKSLSNPSNFMVRIGTPVQALIEAAGGLPEDTGKIVNGGPMMGKAITNLETPVIKGSSGILIIPREKALRKPVMNCIRCSKCISACPMGLEPYLLMNLSERESFERMETEKVMDCIECGSCSFICPSNRPLLDYIRLGKGKVIQIIRARKN
ncbi:MAG: electron transport complex subunit RsxC [Bacteroidales bacterium]|nr:electron transport complex subunit RsxC [Bacteroidales bacterium]